MNINSSHQPMKNVQNASSRVSFAGGGGELLNRLTQVIPDTKASKGLTQLDKNCFQGYVASMRFKLGTTAEEIKSLCSLKEEDFIYGAYDFLTKKMGIPDEIRPVLTLQEQNPIGPMRYAHNYNMIMINPDLSNLTQAEKFGMLRHELQHFRQNMDIFRHETLGEKVVDIHVDALVNSQKATVKHLLTNMSLDEIVQNGFIANENGYNIFLRCQKHLENNDMVAFDKEFESMTSAFRQDVMAFRQKVVDSMGPIKTGTKEAQKAEKYFEDFQNINYFEADGGVDYAKYFASGIEQEAIIAGERAGFELSGEGCFVKYQKDKFKNAIESQDAEVRKMFDDLEKAE